MKDKLTSLLMVHQRENWEEEANLENLLSFIMLQDQQVSRSVVKVHLVFGQLIGKLSKKLSKIWFWKIMKPIKSLFKLFFSSTFLMKIKKMQLLGIWFLRRKNKVTLFLMKESRQTVFMLYKKVMFRFGSMEKK